MNLRGDVFAAVAMKNVFFWDMTTPCGSFKRFAARMYLTTDGEESLLQR
jgi:hypothetical protein